MSRTRLYFAYGSNLLPARLAARTPSARPVGRATLPGHRLAWHKIGVDCTGKCDIVPTEDAGDRVHGALYEIALDDWHALDVAEELGTGYEACRVRVHGPTGAIEAHSYRALITDPELRPFDWYKKFVVHGAREHGLPSPYVKRLEAVEALPDPDPHRVRLNARMLVTDTA